MNPVRPSVSYGVNPVRETIFNFSNGVNDTFEIAYKGRCGKL